MRPVAKTSVPSTELAAHPALALLINVLGPYCSYSERLLPDVAGVWNAQAGAAQPPEKPAADDWDNLLPVDVATLAAAAANMKPADVLRPDRDVTFTVTDASPLVYALEPVQVIYLDDEGKPRGDAVTEQHVIVHGRTDRAKATIDAFALNTRYFDAGRGELRIPRSDYLSMVDTRLHDRKRVWDRATEAASAAASIDQPAMRNLLLDQIRLTASGSGYWSVWATVFWQRFRDAAMLRRLLMEPPESLRRTLQMRAATGVEPAPHSTGPGPHNAFPGTRSDWLG
jgi:hypothetical protein